MATLVVDEYFKVFGFKRTDFQRDCVRKFVLVDFVIDSAAAHCRRGIVLYFGKLYLLCNLCRKIIVIDITAGNISDFFGYKVCNRCAVNFRGNFGNNDLFGNFGCDVIG